WPQALQDGAAMEPGLRDRGHLSLPTSRAAGLPPQWSPVFATGVTGPPQVLLVPGRDAAMEPGLRDRGHWLRNPYFVYVMTSRNGARSSRPGSPAASPPSGLAPPSAMEPGLSDRGHDQRRDHPDTHAPPALDPDPPHRGR